MTWFDYAVITIVILSVLLGCWRGLVYEAISLLGWIAAYVIARWQAAHLALWLPATLGTEAVRIALAFVMVFVATLLVSTIAAWLISKLIKLAGLGAMDKVLGALFGVLRGMLIVLTLVLLAGLTSLPQQAFWRDALLSQPLEKMAQISKVWLPDNLVQRINYGIKY